MGIAMSAQSGGGLQYSTVISVFNEVAVLPVLRRME
jgi:hypothetical protein